MSIHWGGRGHGHRSRRSQAAGGTPTPTPTFTALAVDGDSLSYAAGSPQNKWKDANPSVDFINAATGGASLTVIQARLATTLAGNPSHFAIWVGANDLMEYASAAAYLTAYYGVVAAARALVPGIKVLATGILPIDENSVSNDPPAKAGFNARRATVNAALRAAVGTEIDGYIPFGDHPDMFDAAGTDPAKFEDGLHILGPVQETLNTVFAAVMDSVLQLDTGNVPDNFTLTDQSNIALSTPVTASAMITGLGLGQIATASVTGAGTIARGHGAFGTSNLAMMNGDVVLAKQTSSASNNTPVDTTVTVGGVSDTFTATTLVSSPMTLTASAMVVSAPGNFATSRAYDDVAFPAGRLLIIFNTASGGAWDTCTIDGQTCELVCATGGRQMWLAPFVASTATIHDIAITRAQPIHNVDLYPTALGNMDTGGEVNSAAVLAFVYRADGAHAANAAVTVPGGGIGVAHYHNEGTGAQAARFNVPAGWTLVQDYGNNEYLLSFTASGTPTITSLQYGNTCMIAGAFEQ